MEEYGQENHPSQPAGNDKPRGDGDAVEEGMNHQSHQHRKTTIGGGELVGVGLFTEVEMGSDGVFKEVNYEIADEHQQSGILPAQSKALRNNLDDRGGQHETRAQGDEVLQVGTVPMLLDNDRSAENIGRSRSQAQQQTEEDRVHR